jgi:peptidoglycan/xylan/chitin deacetylase (PgdA/CDA1 family)
MFHHFHNENHNKSQGSIDKEQFAEMIFFLRKKNNLLNADEYLWKLKKNRLGNEDICLTFDDALLCQSDVALPILSSENISAFFFVYSSPLMGKPDLLEVYRFFRNEKFRNVDEFYSAFFDFVERNHTSEIDVAKLKYQKNTYLSAFPFYTENDKWFRFLRDETLGSEIYAEVMRSLMLKHNFSQKEVLTKLWMNNSHVKTLHDNGHFVGLHSHNHPTTMHKLSVEKQKVEYDTNFQHLTAIIGQKPISMSHPCGNYNEVTIEILKKLGIEIGFRSSLSVPHAKSNLEIPRQDHANVLTEMEK